ncbi:hypothetical protein EJB05_10252 [Eragrostis curvula]|uniref:Embryo surrounding factor 1 brassicaceae domain-containing protein n=1 Tax=Eragrostis curvula TaxID=38414 RepID=A0A5J9W8N8_9POAL|nr:hypothetical protein EJB05_10252 [Eragrostis curvula]
MVHNSIMVVVLYVLLFGSLACPSQCRPHLMEAVSNSIATAVNASSSDDRKLSLTFCITSICDWIEVGKLCYCCPVVAKQYCHLTRGECLSNCAKCKPKCSP